MNAPASRRGTLLGVSLAGLCALLAAWLLRGGDPAPPPSVPPAQVPAIPAPSAAEAPMAHAVERIPPAGPAAGPEASSPEPVPEAEGLDGIPMRLVVRDGATGQELTVSSMALVPGRGVARFPAGVTSVPVPDEGDAHALRASPFLAGRSGDYRVTAQLPDGYVEEDSDSPAVGGFISAFAERIDAEVLVWPEARVRLVAVEADGTAAKEAVVFGGTVAGKRVRVQADPTDSRGETLVRGVPFLRGEKVILWANIDHRSAESNPAILRDRVEELQVHVTLPKDVSSFGMGTGVGTMFGGRSGKHRNLRLGERGSARVRVLRRDGRPVPAVTVEVGGESAVTGPDGVATLSDLVVGERKALVSEPGFHTNVGEFVVAAGREAYVELTEAAGASAEVLVVDDEGKPVAGASLQVTTEGEVRYCLIEGGVQTLGIHTGPDGRRTLPGLPPGSAMVSAAFGSRKAQGKVIPGGSVEIKLPAIE